MLVVNMAANGLTSINIMITLTFAAYPLYVHYYVMTTFDRKLPPQAIILPSRSVYFTL